MYIRIQGKKNVSLCQLCSGQKTTTANESNDTQMAQLIKRLRTKEYPVFEALPLQFPS